MASGFVNAGGGGSQGGVNVGVGGTPPINGGGGGGGLPYGVASLPIPVFGGSSTTINNAAGGSGLDAQLLQQLLGLVGSGLGTALNSGAIQQAMAMLQKQTDKYGQLGQYGMDKANPLYDQSSGALASILGGSSPWTNLQMNSLIPNVGQLNNLLPGLAQRNFATDSPQIMDALGRLTQNSGSGPLQTLLDRAQQNVNNGGATANSQNMFGQYQSMQNGGTPVMQDLANGGASLLSSSGMTPQLASALAQTQGLLRNGGGNAATDALTNRGLQLAGGQALAPMQAILSGALDQAGTREAQAATNARAQAMARGGGPGATVANGVSNSAMADFADQGARAQAEAVQQALMAQQGLQLQQQGQGANMAQGGQSLEAQRLSELLNSTSNLTATSTGRMGVGGNLLSNYNQGSLGAGSLANAVMTLEMGNQTANMGQLSQGVGTQSSMLNSVIASLLSGAQGGAQAGANLGGLYLGNQNSYANILGNGSSNYTNAAQLLGSLGGNFLNFSGNMYGDMGPTVTAQSQYAAQSPWGQFADKLGAALSSGTYSNIFNKGGTNSTTLNLPGAPADGSDSNTTNINLGGVKP